jgi:S1-C subfamily serine protease
MKTKPKVFLFIFLLSLCFLMASGYSFIDGKVSLAKDEINLINDYEKATVLAIKKVIPAVVSIVVKEEITNILYDPLSGSSDIKVENKDIGSGTGFIVTADGLILTNKHVASDKTKKYYIILNSGDIYEATIVAQDPLEDIALMKINKKNLPAVTMGNSSQLEIGQTAIAIGNSLGRYQNSATRGIISGIGRSLVASDQLGRNEALVDIIQTDAAINLGNSGGPLINLTGEVVGINTAIETSGENVGFAIPINLAKSALSSYKKTGQIVRPKLGLRYIMITPAIAKFEGLKYTYGALITKGDEGREPAIVPDSPADKAGLKEDDIILEINAMKVAPPNSLSSIIKNYSPGQLIGLRVARGDKIFVVKVRLDEFK